MQKLEYIPLLRSPNLFLSTVSQDEITHHDNCIGCFLLHKRVIVLRRTCFKRRAFPLLGIIGGLVLEGELSDFLVSKYKRQKYQVRTCGPGAAEHVDADRAWR